MDSPDIEKRLPEEQVQGILNYIYTSAKCPYCHEFFELKATIVTIAKHIETCIIDSEKLQGAEFH